MRKAISALCLLALISVLLSIPYIAGMLPMSKREYIEAKYDSWTGVLRIWIYEGWQAGNGSLSLWLNECISAYERAHPGVYIQPKYVDAQAIITIGENGINPPDMVLFPPGLLDSPSFLTTIYTDFSLRDGLESVGQFDGETYAVPVAMGAYCWVYNQSLLEQIPATWSDLDGDSLLQAPPDEQYRSWSGAVLALCSGLSAATAEQLPLPGVEIGLPDAETAPTAAPETVEDEGGGIVCQLPEGFVRSDSAYSAFTSGKAAAIAATQRELRRLDLLSDSGRAPDWAVSMPGKYAYADQTALMGIVEWERGDIGERQARCAEFIDLLLTDESQAKLAKSRAFPVVPGVTAYEGRGTMAQVEALLGQKKLIAPNAFEPVDSVVISALLDAFQNGTLTARDALDRLR